MSTTWSFHGGNGGRPIHALGAAAGPAAIMGGRIVVATALIALALSAGTGPLGAHDNGGKSEQTLIKSREFTIPKGQCSQLPADLEVKGLGRAAFAFE